MGFIYEIKFIIIIMKYKLYIVKYVLYVFYFINLFIKLN